MPNLMESRSLGWINRIPAVVDTVLAVCDDLLERMGGNRLRDLPTAVLLLLPSLGLLGVFGLLPLLLAVYLSLFTGKGVNMQFAGLANYTRALSSGEFWSSLLNTFYYAVGTIVGAFFISFAIASLLFRLARGRGFFRTVYFLPYITSVVAAATIWRVLLHPYAGPVNVLLAYAGVSPENLPRWLLEPKGVLHLLTNGAFPENWGPSLALCCVILFDIWHSSGFMIVILLAGLTAIPRELEEAAVIDGAGWYARNRYVIVPLISPTIFFLLIMSVIKAFQAFNSFYALTGDGRGPYDSTQNMTVYIFTNLYVYQRLGYGAAVAVLLAVAIVILTLVQWRYVGRKVHYE